MHETLNAVYDIALIVTLWATGVGLGAAHGLRSVGASRRRPALVARIVVLDVVVIPVAVALLVRALSVPHDYATGLIIVGVASAGPLGLKATQLARGDVALAIALVVILELANIVAMPLWAALLLDGATALPVADILRTLLVAVLVPLSIGFAVRAVSPMTAARLAGPSTRLSSIGLLVVIGAVLLRDGDQVIAAVGAGVPAVAVLTIGLALAIGWIVGGPEPATRRTSALVSSVRANAVALAVASTAFGSTAGVTSAIAVFGLCSLVIPPGAAVLLGRSAQPSPTGAGLATADADGQAGGSRRSRSSARS